MKCESKAKSATIVLRVLVTTEMGLFKHQQIYEQHWNSTWISGITQPQQKKIFMITMWFWSKRRRRSCWKKLWKRIATDHNDYMCQFWRKHFNTESYFYVKKQRIRCGYFLLNCEINDTVNAQFQSKWGMKKSTHTEWNEEKKHTKFVLWNKIIYMVKK